MKTQITTADNHINQDKTDKMKNLKCYLTHTCSASKPLPVTIVACVVHLPPLPSQASGPPGKKQPDNQLCRTTARRWAAARGGQGGQKVQEFIPGKRGPVLVKVSLHSFAVIVHGGGEGGGVFWPDGMQPCRIPITEMGSIAGAAICLNQFGWSESNWVTVGFTFS